MTGCAPAPDAEHTVAIAIPHTATYMAVKWQS